MDAQLRHITTAPNELCARLHNRLLVILKPEAWPVWRGEATAEAPQALQGSLVTEEVAPMQRPPAPRLCVKCRLGQFLLQRS